jgi:hypothetical protein
MNKKSGEEPPEPPPEPTDLNGWRRALAEDRLRDFRPEAIVAAFQDLGRLLPDPRSVRGCR